MKIIKSYKKKYPNKITIINTNTNCGSSASNFMELTKYAKADYVMYSDQDDVWLPNKVEETLLAMKKLEKENNKEIPILVFGNYTIVNEKLERINQFEKNNQISKYNLEFNRLIVQNYVTGCLIMVNKALYKQIGKYDKSILMHDWWIALIASSMGVIYHLDKELMLYRQHSNNVVGAVNIKSLKYRIKKLLDPNTKYSQVKYKNQIELFNSRFRKKLDNKNKTIIDNYLSIFNTKNKFKRINILIKGKYLKSDFIRIIGQIFYI
jgi:hypothetical protein